MASIDAQIHKTYAFGIAWPTIIWSLLNATVFTVNLTLFLQGKIPLWIAGPISILMCYMAFTPVHEAVHKNVQGKHKNFKPVEEFCGYLCAAMLLGPLETFRFIHMTHHGNTNHPTKDPDYWVATRNPFMLAIKCLTIYPHYLHFYFSEKSIRGKKSFYRTLWGVMILYSFFFFLVFTFGAFNMIAIWAAPALIAHGFLAITLDYLPHTPHTKRGRYLDTTTYLGKLHYILSMGHSYHVVHHLWPRVPFYRYKKVFHLYRESIEANGSETRQSLIHHKRPRQRATV